VVQVQGGLAFSTSFDIFCDVFPHFWPPMGSFGKLYCFTDTWVSIYGEIMVIVDDFAFFLCLSCDDHSTVFI
jgi:hypothetical protein